MRDFKVGERVTNTELQRSGEVVHIRQYGYGHSRPVVQYDDWDMVTTNPEKLKREGPPAQ